MTGSICLTDSPRPELSRGTSRQPSSTWPSSLIARSISYSQASREAGSCGRNTIPTPYSPKRGQPDPLLAHLFAEEPVRDLQQDAGAIPGQRVGADGTPMGEILQDQQPVLDDGVALRALDVGDEAHATGVVFPVRVVQALLAGQHRVRHGRSS